MHLAIQKCQAGKGTSSSDSIMFTRGTEQVLHVHFMAVAAGLHVLC